MKKRLLFVDDEELIRELYSTLSGVLGAGHEVRTAATGQEALALLRDQPFDIVVSDLAMPHMDGVEFLSHVVRQYPESARIVVSGFADRLKVAECSTVSHRVFNKPFNFKALAELLKRICQYNYLLNDERLRRMVCGKKALPTPPDTYLRLTEALNNPYVEVDEIGRIVERDAGMTTKLIQIVNSAQFGLGHQIVSANEAVQFLGVEVVRSLIVGAQVFSFFEGSDFLKQVFGDLWNHSLRTAIAARKLALAEKLPGKACDESFLAGLLHDIGKLILAANSEPEYRLVLDLVQKKGHISLTAAEAGIYGSDHPRVGAYLMALWGMPDSVISAVEQHHSLERANVTEFNALLAVHVAQNLDPAAGREKFLDQECLDRLGLCARIPVWRELLADTEGA